MEVDWLLSSTREVSHLEEKVKRKVQLMDSPASDETAFYDFFFFFFS